MAAPWPKHGAPPCSPLAAYMGALFDELNVRPQLLREWAATWLRFSEHHIRRLALTLQETGRAPAQPPAQPSRQIQFIEPNRPHSHTGRPSDTTAPCSRQRLRLVLSIYFFYLSTAPGSPLTYPRLGAPALIGTGGAPRPRARGE